MKDLESAIAEMARDSMKRDVWDVPLDYFSWGRDRRHRVQNTERLPTRRLPKNLFPKAVRMIAAFFAKPLINTRPGIMWRFRKHYKLFDQSYQLMADHYSRTLFAELIFMKLVSEKNMRLSSFTQDFIDSYETASNIILSSDEALHVYSWVLRKISLNSPPVSFFTVPNVLNLHLTGRLYRYQRAGVVIEVKGGDIVLDAGVGWGDTTIYLAARANQETGGHVYAFDILEEGLNALAEQCRQNPAINNISPILGALSDKDGDMVHISAPSPGARIVGEKTEKTVESVSIDTFAQNNALAKIDFIKMDIEGGEVSALTGAAQTIKKFKPRLAISVYHKWDDLLVIPQLIHSIRNDYKYYLDCTTGFGGEAVLYCS